MNPEKPGEDMSSFTSPETNETKVEKPIVPDHKVGDKVRWQLHGMLMWDRRRPIIEIKLDPKTNRMCGYFANDERGYPLEDLTKR